MQLIIRDLIYRSPLNELETVLFTRRNHLIYDFKTYKHRIVLLNGAEVIERSCIG